MPDAANAPWKVFLNLRALEPAYGREGIIAALSHRYQYVRSPTYERGEICATLERSTVSAESAVWRGRRVQRPQTFDVTVRFDFQTPERARLLSGCSCNGWGMRCEHAPALLVDLAVHPAMLDALIEGQPTRYFVDELPPLRAAALEEYQAATVGAHWFTLPPRAASRSWDIRLSVLDPRAPSARDVPPDVPTLELRLQDPTERTLLDPRDIVSRPVPMFERRLMALGAPLARGRKGVSLTATSASVALHLLSTSHRDVHLGESGREHLRFSPHAASLRVVRTTLPRGSLSMGARPWLPGASERDEVQALEGRWSVDADGLDVSARDAVLFTGPFPFVWISSISTFYPVDPSVDLDVAWSLYRRPSAELPVRHAATVYAGLQKALAGRAVKLPPPEQMGLAPRAEATMTLRVAGAPLDVRATLEARYDFGTLTVGPAGPLAPVDFEHDVRRDREREESVTARVLAAGLHWSEADGAFVAAQQEAVDFWVRGIAALREEHHAPMQLFVAENLKHVAVRPPVKPRVRVSLSGGLLDTEVRFDVGELAADIELVREALKNKKRWVALDDGSVAEIQDAVAAFVDELAEVMPAKSSKVKLAAHQLGRVERWVDAGVGGEIDPAIEGFRTRLRALAVKGDAELPKGLDASLRPYQMQGVAWLEFLDGIGAGGILADDMGLGKTVTALTALLWRKERDGHAPSLVVCPTSVAPNWVREAARFTPDLKVHLYHGIAREKDAATLEAADIVVTTYALLRRDVALLAGIKWRYALLDEAQNIKNAGAQTAQSARELTAERRLALTGTPVENNLGELWSIMDFCNPGMLGSARDFSTRYERGISIDPKGAEAIRLRAMVRPFLLRRTKREVLKELPPKQEIDQVVAPTARQRRLYDALSATLLADVERKIEEVGLARSGINILTALLRLRQMACDPRLVDAGQPAATSAKRDAFLDLVRALTAESRRVLVFSQFVELLTLWRADLDAAGIGYEYLDGRTRDREGAVTRFQSGNVPLFLISLKAGGTGLNLTAADTVIHCDPWWNPAVEDQATDRAHRIGQTRSVTVYRLITKGTVEEKIVALKGRKKELAEAVIAEDAGALKGLSADDIRLLLGGAEGDGFEDDDEPAGETLTLAKAPKRRAAKGA
ncbi:MAG: SNF2-related protein [Polyangiales bacterium]